MPDLLVRFKPTEQDMLHAVRALPRRHWSSFLFVLLLSLLFLVGIFLIDHDFAMIGYAWLALSVIIAVASYQIPRNHARRVLKKNPSLQGDVLYAFSEEGFETTFATGHSQVQWTACVRSKETEHSFLLFFSPERYATIPKRVMSREQIEALRALLNQHVLKATIDHARRS